MREGDAGEGLGVLEGETGGRSVEERERVGEPDGDDAGLEAALMRVECLSIRVLTLPAFVGTTATIAEKNDVVGNQQSKVRCVSAQLCLKPYPPPPQLSKSSLTKQHSSLVHC